MERNIYKIKKGDNLSRLAHKYGTTVKELAKLNNIKNVNLIYEGSDLVLPSTKEVKKEVKAPLVPLKKTNKEDLVQKKDVTFNQRLTTEKTYHAPGVVVKKTIKKPIEKTIEKPRFNKEVIKDLNKGIVKPKTKAQSIELEPSVPSRTIQRVAPPTKDIKLKTNKVFSKENEYREIDSETTGVKSNVLKKIDSSKLNPNKVTPIAKVKGTPSLESGVVFDKGENVGYRIKDHKVVDKFNVLTGQQGDPNVSYESHTLDYLHDKPESRITPTGYFGMEFTPNESDYSKKVYGENNVGRMRPLDSEEYGAVNANGIAAHKYFTGREKMLAYREAEDRRQSMGCVNCGEEEIKNIYQQFPGDDRYRKDTALIADSRHAKDRAEIEKHINQKTLEPRDVSMSDVKEMKYGGEINPNDTYVSFPEGFVGMGSNTQGRDYSPAWGGQFQNGGEMRYYQEGLDFQPKGMQDGGWLNKYQNGGVVQDDNEKKILKYGGELDQLTNFTNYNKPQPGGWLNKYTRS